MTYPLQRVAYVLVELPHGDAWRTALETGRCDKPTTLGFKAAAIPVFASGPVTAVGALLLPAKDLRGRSPS